MSPEPMHPQPPDAVTGRRPAVKVVLALVVALVVSLAGVPADAAPRGNAEYLIAADPVAQTIYTYRTSDLRRTGQLDGIGLGSHVGTLQLPDGRLIMVDDAHARVLAMRVDRQGRPQVVQSAGIASPKSWVRTAWAAADANLRYFAFTSDFEDSASQLVTIVDLRTFATSQLEVALTADSTGAYAETQVYLAGRPLQVVVTTGGEFRSFPLRAVLERGAPQATSSAPLGPNNHGPVVSRDGDRVYSTTADGFDGAEIPGRTLTNPRSVPYSATRNVVQSYRPRLAGDGRTVWGAAAEDSGLSPAGWADTRNVVNRIDTERFSSSVTRLPDGIAGRLALSRRYTAVTTQSPDGDVLTLLDARQDSTRYGRTVGTVALDAPSEGPVAGTPAAGTQGHTLALTASGRRAFVSNGGDGTIAVVDTDARTVVGQLRTPTPLTGGGYLTVVKVGTPVADLVAR